MATRDDIHAMLQGLSGAGLERVRLYVELVRRQEQGGGLNGSIGPETWCYDFVENYHEATRSASRDPAGMECKSGDATCAGMTQPAVWEHPPVTGSAMIGYLVAIPSGLKAVRLKFAIGIRDGAELPPDQFVAFRVLVNGWKLWSAVKNSHTWEEHELVMPQLGSDVARVEFVTDGLGHHRWDWSVWGSPRLEGERAG